MRVLQELNTIYQLLFRSIKGESHAERIEDFYRGQAERYDAFREQLLYGRRELLRALPFVEDGDEAHVGELQMHIAAIIEKKEAAHVSYGITRGLERFFSSKALRPK